jgi:hypothetical protein
LSPWAIAGLPEKLPPGSYRFARRTMPCSDGCWALCRRRRCAAGRRSGRGASPVVQGSVRLRPVISWR